MPSSGTLALIEAGWSGAGIASRAAQRPWLGFRIALDDEERRDAADEQCDCEAVLGWSSWAATTAGCRGKSAPTAPSTPTALPNADRPESTAKPELGA
jgi:hypothetical protein